MSKFSIEVRGLDELKRAIQRNPTRVIEHTQTFLQRGMAIYRSGIQNNPWRVGESGGGAPVDTRNLLQSHAVRYDRLEASIGPSRNYYVRYAQFVHEAPAECGHDRGLTTLKRPAKAKSGHCIKTS